MIRKLIERGRKDGSFRTDVPVGWLVTTTLALVHAAAEEVRTGELDAEAARSTLTLTITDLLRRVENPPGGSARGSRDRRRR